MSSLKMLTALALLSLPAANGAAQCNETWNGSTSANWGDATNWTVNSGVGCTWPGATAGNGDTAGFSGSSQLTVQLTLSDGVTFINPHISTLNLSAMNYVINPETLIPSPHASLFFDAVSTPNTITVGAGTTQTINTPMESDGANPLVMTIGANATLNIVGAAAFTPFTALTYSGPGTLNVVDKSATFNNPGQAVFFNASTTYMSNTGALFINNGTVQLTNNLDLTSSDGVTIFLGDHSFGTVYINDGGILALENNNSVLHGDSFATYFLANKDIRLPSGTGVITLTNNGNILGTGSTTVGCYLRCPFGELYVGPGTSVTSNNFGLINNFEIGTVISGSSIVLDGGSITLINSGAVGPNNAWGSAIGFTLSMTVNSGTLLLQSTGSNVIDSGGYGCLVQVGSFNQSGGLTQITNTNTGGGSGIGSELNPYGSMNVTGGVVQNDVWVASPMITVSGTGTLCGTGIYAGTDGTQFPPVTGTSLTNMGATLLAGDTLGGAPGVLTIVGEYTQNTAGTFAVNLLTLNGDVPGPTSFSQLVVNGPANIEGSVTAALSPGQTVMNGDAYTILTSTGLTGTFELGVIPVNFPTGYSAALSYPPGQNNVVLTITIGPPPSPPGPPSPALLGPTLTSYPAYYQSIFASVNHTHTRLEREMRGLRNRFNTEKETAPPVSRSTTSSGVIPSAGKIPMELIQNTSNQIGKDRNPAVAFMNWEQTQKQHQLTQKVQSGETRPWNVYLGPIGTSGEINTKHATVGYNEWSAGGLAGFDYAFSHVGIGIMADYERVQGYVNHHWGEFSINQAHVSAYFTYAPKPLPKLGINAIVGGGYDWVNIHRHTEGKTAKGDSQVGEFDALFGLEYTFVKEERCGYGQFQFTPMVNVQYIYLDIDRYREHSAGFNDFKIHGQVAKSLRSTLGTWLGYLWEWCDFAFKPEVYLAWQREYFDRKHTLYVNPLHFLAPTTPLGMQGEGRNTYQAGLDLMFTLFNQYGLEVSYDFEWNNLFRDHAFYLGFNAQF